MTRTQLIKREYDSVQRALATVAKDRRIQKQYSGKADEKTEREYWRLRSRLQSLETA